MKRLAIITILIMVTVAGYSQSALTYSIIRSLDTLVLRAKSQPNRMVFPMTRGAGQGSVLRQGANGYMYFGTPDSLGGGGYAPFDSICLDYCNGCTGDTGLIIVDGCFIKDTLGGLCGTPTIVGDTLFLCGDTIVASYEGYWTLNGNKLFNNSGTLVGINTADPKYELDINGNLFGRKAGHFEGGDGNVNGVAPVNATDAQLMAGYGAGTTPWFQGLIRGDISGNTVIGKADADLVNSIFVGSRTLLQAQQFGRYLDGWVLSPLLDSTSAAFRSFNVINNAKYLNISQAPNANPFNVVNDKVGTDSLMSVTDGGWLGVGTDSPTAPITIKTNTKPQIRLLNSIGRVDALIYADSAKRNVGMGNKVFKNITTGSYNVALGHEAVEAVTDGWGNIGIGYNALEKCTTAVLNIGIGFNAGGALLSGTGNVAIGGQSLFYNKIGVDNVAIGNSAMHGITGSYNVAIGSGAGSRETRDFKIYIGKPMAGGSLHLDTTTTPIYINASDKRNAYADGYWNQSLYVRGDIRAQRVPGAAAGDSCLFWDYTDRTFKMMPYAGESAPSSDTSLPTLHGGTGIEISGSRQSPTITNTSPNVPEVFGDSTFKLATIGGATKVHPWYGKKAINPLYPYFYTDGPMPSFTTQLNLDGTMNAYAFRSEITTAGKVNSMNAGGSSLLTSAYDGSTYVGTSGLINSTEDYFYMTAYKSTSTASAPIFIGTIATNDNYNGKYLKIDDSLQVFTVNFDTVKLAGKLPTLPGEADSIMRPDYANGGRLAMQKANTGGIGNSAVTPTSAGYMTTPYLNMMLSDSAKWSAIDRNGFVNADQTTLSFDETTHILTLGSVGPTWQYMRGGRLFTITGSKTIDLDTVSTGFADGETYYITIKNNTGDLSVSETLWTLTDLTLPVAVINWHSGLYPKYWLANEKHQSLMDRRTHLYLHVTQGAQLVSGATLSGYVQPSGTTNADNTFRVGPGYTVLADEDLFQTLDSLQDPSGATGSGAYIPFYHATSTTYAWDTSDMPYKFTAGGYIEYDNGTTTTQGSSGNFYNSYLLVTDKNGAARYSIVMGRSAFATAALAYAENPASFNWSGFPIAEAVIAYQLTWEAKNTYDQKGKCRLTRAPQRINSTITTTSTATPAIYVSHPITGNGSLGSPLGVDTTTTAGVATQYDIATMTLPISRVTALQDSLTDNYNKRDTASVLVSKPFLTTYTANRYMGLGTGYLRADTSSVLASKSFLSTYVANRFSPLTHNHTGVYQPVGSYLTENQSITLSGDASGTGTTSITVTVADDSHNHVIGNVDALQDSLNAKYTKTQADNKFAPKVSATFTNLTTADSVKVNRSIKITAEPATDATESGTTAGFLAGESLVFGDVVYLKSDGKVWKADADAEATAPVMGMATGTFGANATAKILLFGIARQDSWTWTVGGKLYLSATAGAITQTAPTGTDKVVQIIGIATHADRILFNPSLFYITLN